MKTIDSDILISKIITHDFKANMNDENANCVAKEILEIIRNTTDTEVDITEEMAIDKLHSTGWLVRHDKVLTETPQDKLIMVRCDKCGAYNFENIKNALTAERAINLLQRQIHFLYHNAPEELQSIFDDDFPENWKINGIEGVSHD